MTPPSVPQPALPAQPVFWRRVLFDGTAAALLSSAVLAWRGYRDTQHAQHALNAPSHWVWGDEAIAARRWSLRHTLLGHGIHHASSLLWAAAFQGLQRHQARQGRPRPWRNAVVVSAMAALVDLRLVPPRLTPGFERRLSRSSLLAVYAGFGAGLALAAVWRDRRHAAARPARAARAASSANGSTTSATAAASTPPT